LYGDGATAVILAPTYPGGQDGWAAFAKAAAGQGYRALSFDFRGYGSSKGSQSPAALPTDIRAAMSFLKEHNSQRIVLIGAGLGGSAAIVVTAKDPAGISGVALISAPRGVEGLQVADTDLAALKVPSLWLAARNDLTQNVEEMSALAGSAQKDMWIYEGSSLHGTYIFDGADGSDLQRRLLEFVAQVTA
jgi:pimeloyl-ACP methyl ester carboxylesterase